MKRRILAILGRFFLVLFTIGLSALITVFAPYWVGQFVTHLIDGTDNIFTDWILGLIVIMFCILIIWIIAANIHYILKGDK